MSNYKLVYVKPQFIAETIARTGTEEILEKENRSYVGLYNQNDNWYIPLRSNIGKLKPKGAYYETPFLTKNPHFKRPGLDFEKSLYVPTDQVVEIRNTLPFEQNQFILDHRDDIQDKFEEYVLSTENFNRNSNDYLFSTVPLFPEGVERIKEKHIKNETINFKQELYDDPTISEGGISYQGETLEHFMDDVGLTKDASLKEINDTLQECGIQTISYSEVENKDINREEQEIMETTIQNYKGEEVPVVLEVHQYAANETLALYANEKDTGELYTELTTYGSQFRNNEGEGVTHLALRSDKPEYKEALEKIGFLEVPYPFYQDPKGNITIDYYDLSEEAIEFCNGEIAKQQELDQYHNYNDDELDL
ncbi:MULTISPECIES: hypothetical protein [Aerococcus]|uniref:hypothetical protein n=1 Tax=Aerococcus TaxID=1375 RepID=UPI0018A6D9DA|nr:MULTISPECIES: hypothetical protein [Aerococcus]MCY3067598.1 hypothetical protein [Aerococcus mictus]MCY3080867.1 hypothetical protein [Aerococcus mictus]MDK8485472.1 hypothetical protein [Aerococcus urinae]